MPCSSHTMIMSPSSGVAARHTPHTMNHELLRASATGDRALLEHALGLSSSAGSRRSCLKGVTSEGNTALHTAAGRGYLELVRIICDQDASLIEARNNLCNTPLICAARAGHVDVVRYLIDRAPATASGSGEAPMLKARNSEGATAMHEAIRNGHGAVLETLVSADASLAAVVDAKGFSPLYLAAALGRADMVDVLIRGSPDEGKSTAYYAGPDGQTALHAAVLVSEEMSKSLWCWEPTLAKKEDNFGNTALHHAASAGKTGAVRLLLQEDSSLAYIPDADGLFPVHTAAKMGKIDVIEQLMEACPNCDELLDGRGRNVLHCAIEHKREKVVRHVLRRMSPRMVNARDGSGNTPLHLAVRHGCDRIAILLVRDVRVHLSTMNNDGATPLDVAIGELDHGYTYPMNPEVLIAQCLLWCGARRSPRRRDECLLPNHNSGRHGEKELSKYSNLTQIRAIGSVLIATLTFGAPFTLRSSVSAVDDERPAFRAFILCNAVAFLCSTVATCLLMYAGLTTVHPRHRSRYHRWSSNLLHVGVLLVIATFALSVQLALGPPHRNRGLNVAVCAMACVSVVFTHPGTWWPMMLARPIRARLGIKGLLDVLLAPRPVPCQKLLLSRTPWLNLFKMLATLLILAMILVTFLWDAAHHRMPPPLLQYPPQLAASSSCLYPT